MSCQKMCAMGDRYGKTGSVPKWRTSTSITQLFQGVDVVRAKVAVGRCGVGGSYCTRQDFSFRRRVLRPICSILAVRALFLPVWR